MNIEKIVFQHASKLKKQVGTSLSKGECFDIINNAVSEAVNEVNDNFVLDNNDKILNAYEKGVVKGRNENLLKHQ